jgi:hypothetical protein
MIFFNKSIHFQIILTKFNYRPDFLFFNILKGHITFHRNPNCFYFIFLHFIFIFKFYDYEVRHFSKLHLSLDIIPSGCYLFLAAPPFF